MPIAHNHGVYIHYEVVGSSPALVLLSDFPEDSLEYQLQKRSADQFPESRFIINNALDHVQLH